MRPAHRLFQIIQILRRSTRPVTAARIAEELEVSRRTVYRDIADLIGQRVPIVGEAGFGFLLDAGYDMPPLMLTPDEIEAVVLGAQWVAGRGDPTLARAAQDLISKVMMVVPESLRPFIIEPSVGTPPPRAHAPEPIDLADLRQAIRDGRKLHLHYRSPEGRETERKVCPVVLGYGEASRVIVAPLLPSLLHTLDVVELKVTGLPEAPPVALTESGASVSSLSLSAANVIACVN